MNILSWNCQGSGGLTVSTLNRYLRCTGAQIAFISETRCGLVKAEQRTQLLSLSNHKVVASNGKSGGLWLLWSSQVNAQIIEADSNLIVAEISEQGVSYNWLLVAIYGDPTRRGNPLLWERIEAYTNQEGVPICIIGDFNSISCTSEKWGGSSTLSSPNRAFRDWVHGNGLLDLGHHGPAYTWSNKQQGSRCIAARLDRALANMDWTLKYPDTAVFHLPRFQSDHLPILLRTELTPIIPKHKFRCEEWWSQREGFTDVCTKSAQEGLGDWCNVRKSFKREVKKWGGGSVRPSTMLKQIEQKMGDLLLQNPPGDTCNEEKVLQAEHRRVLQIEESYCHQRARVN